MSAPAADAPIGPPPAAPRGALTLLFAVTLFTSAALLFWVQPLVAKMILPLLGGTPAVWNTSLLFFQSLLLAGYAYALFASRRLSLRRQAGAQVLLLLAAALALPVALSEASAQSAASTANPSLWLLGTLLTTVGLPFFVLSTLSPLLQRWFAQTGHTSSGDPYFLYAASNAGSLLALVAFPALLEPSFRLTQQGRLWSLGYAALALLVIACALLTLRHAGRDETRRVGAEGETGAREAVTVARRLRWLALAFVPSSLMLGVTTYISTDIASLPLLWIIPLSVYLLTLILAFARRPLPWRWVARLLPGATVVLVLVYLSGATQPAFGLALLHLFYLFVAAYTCHGRLAEERPAPAHLAEFYLWMSVGGALGGLFNALVAPKLFNAVVEYPLVILLACFFVPRGEEGETRRSRLPELKVALPPDEGAQTDARARRRALWLDVLLPLGLLLLTQWVAMFVTGLKLGARETLALIYGVPLVVAYLFKRRPLRFALAVGAVMLASALYKQFDRRTLFAARNFFGVVRVVEEPDGSLRWLHHGTTIHGRQFTAPARRCEPLSYYHRTGPLGSLFESFHAQGRRGACVAAVGLGTGAAVAYARPGESWTFYEINPAIIRLAREDNYFTYLSSCAAAPLGFELGDARLRLQHAPDAAYDLIILDAFSSDAIPVHLMTREALALYLLKLAPGGLITFHISNRSLDLHPVIANLAAGHNLAALGLDDTDPHPPEGKEPSQWVVLARRPQDFGPLAQDARWHALTPTPDSRAWTDDYSDIVSIFKWR